ncbi:hypothetical protein DEO72_LG3g1485 [Vigna unguiculata]|uniref:Uncharacterized protein n=1 Tax=Vigna unguiculata TaxID=3917 RepID=A0A4D6LFG2_VIGUN|nr:hypothetical protein DEO72_LG3g1485 [Vigna unguiculata]
MASGDQGGNRELIKLNKEYRNRLAAYEQPPGGICDFAFFWVFSVNGLAAEHEPPGGTSIMTLFFGCGVLDVFYDAP